MDTPAIVIRPMNKEDRFICLSWASKEGWNPGCNDEIFFTDIDPAGFLMGTLQGEPIASISAVRWGDAFSFIGYYIVKDTHRMRGYGIKMFNSALERLQGRLIGLDAVLAQQHNYERSGFIFSHYNNSYECKGGGSIPQIPETLSLQELTPNDGESFSLYEQDFFPCERTSFLSVWIKQPNSYGFKVIEASTNKPVGFGLIRKAEDGYHIAPLYADTLQIAKIIFQTLQAKVDETSTVHIDCPESNEESKLFVQQCNLKKFLTVARMFKGKGKLPSSSKIFGCLAYEVG